MTRDDMLIKAMYLLNEFAFAMRGVDWMEEAFAKELDEADELLDAFPDDEEAPLIDLNDPDVAINVVA